MAYNMKGELRVKKDSVFIHRICGLSFTTIFTLPDYFNISNYPSFRANTTVIQLAKGGVVKMKIYELKSLFKAA